MVSKRLLATLALFFIQRITFCQSLEGLDIQSFESLFGSPKAYAAVKCSDPIVLDGKLNEKSWSNARWTDYFVDIEGDKQPKPRLNTRVKMVWDEKYLYIAAELEEPHIWAYLKNHDEVVFRDNDFEIFIDPENCGQRYFEYEVNAKGTIFDLFLLKSYRVGGHALVTWNFEGLKQGISIDGTLNNGKDIDKKWVVEVAIPYAALGFNFSSPATDKPWRINFSRVEWDTKFIGDKYVKDVDPTTGKPKPEHNWVWSPQGVVNMHFPERWGYLFFVNKTSLDPSYNAVVPQTEIAKNALWAVFYNQEKFRSQNKRFAKTLDEIGCQEQVKVNGVAYKLSLEATSGQYQASLFDTNGVAVARINHEGLIF